MKSKHLLLASCLTFAMLAPISYGINAFASNEKTIGIENTVNAEPDVQITKTASWYNPSGDNASVDFDDRQDIDIDGIVRVEVKVNIKNVMLNSESGTTSASGIVVTDSFDDSKWVLAKKENLGYGVSDGVFVQKGNTILWTIPKYNSGYDVTLIYYLQLKEAYWDVESETNYFVSTNEISIDYNVNGENKTLSCASPCVEMRRVNWVPQVKKLSIDVSEYVYKNIKSRYGETYFVNSNVLTGNSLMINAESSMNRSYSGYQIGENLFDIYQADNNQVISSSIKLNENTSTTIVDDTARSVSLYYTPASLLDIFGTNNEKGTVETGLPSTGIVEYNGAKLSTKASLLARGDDSTTISIYPFARTISSDGISYETSRDMDLLKNKKIELVVDGTTPTLTTDIKFQTISSDGVTWTDSDGYIDINLVDGKVNPEKSAHTLSFRITDNESGISNPDFLSDDWVETSSDNVQITLKRVDNEEITIFDSNINKNNRNDFVSVQYSTSSDVNDTAIVKIILDPENKDMLGHLKLTIRVYDNVKNSIEKTYDIYSFCLTGKIETDNNIPKEGKTEGVVVLEGGERGRIDITAAGYADSVDVEFESKLETEYAKEMAQRITFNAPTVLAGSYPHDDIVNYADSSAYSSFNKNGKYILPKELQVNSWSVSEDKLGGVDVSLGFDKLNDAAAEKEAYKESVRTQKALEKEEAIREMVDEMIEEILAEYEVENEEEDDEDLDEEESYEDLYDYNELYAIAKAKYEETEEPDEFDFVKNDVLQDNLVDLLKNYSNNSNTSLTGDNFHLEGVTLYTYPTFNAGKISTYIHVYKLNYSNPVTIGGKAYPTSIILDGNTNIEVQYQEIDGGIIATVEDYTDVTSIDDQIQASWIVTESGMKRPLSHYFYMPLNAPETYYTVRVTEYKDSDTAIPHSVYIELTFSNTAQGSKALSELHTMILDN